VQTVAAALFDAVTHKKVREERYDAANRTMQRRITAHFADLWRSLSPEAQTATVILVLAEMKGRVDGRDFDTGDLEMLDWYGPELDRLADSGLVERDDCKEWRSDQGNFAVWRGKRWRVTAGSFVWWVASNAIASTRKVLDFEQWLQDREFEGCLTRGQKKKFKELAGYIPKGVVTNAGEFLGTLLKGWLTSG
jgi:hypothetical protein